MTTPSNPDQPGDPQYQQQPQQYGQQQYGQQQPYPSAPPVSDTETRRPDKPAAVDRAWLLWLVAAGLSLIGSILSFANSSALIDAENQKLAAQGVQISGSSSGTGTAIFSIVLLVLWVACVFTMRNGANWARIVLTVLGVLSVIGTVISLIGVSLLFSTGFVGVLELLLDLASAVVIILAIVNMFKKESSAYFKSS